MSDAQENRGKRKGGGGWIFLLLLLVLGVAAYLSGAGNIDWQAKLASLREGGPGTGEPAAPVKPAAKSVTPPSFDVAYAQPTGQLVIAGRGEPGWAVKIESDGAVIGEVTADRNGEWVFNPEDPLAPGEHSLSLSASDKASGRSVAGSQRIALSITAKPGEQPVVALSDTDKATRLLQGGEKVAQAPGSPGTVTFDAVDYEKSGKGGRVLISGHAVPGARVMLYINNGFVGVATAGADGVWSFAGARDLPLGSHKIRADMVPGGAERVAARAEVNFERTKDTREAMAEIGEKKAAGMASIGSAKPAPRSAARKSRAQSEAGADDGGSETASRSSKRQRGDCDAIVVQRGDTLWSIAERCYGSGERYTKIFRSNKGQIRDPDMIYPDQRFVLP